MRPSFSPTPSREVRSKQTNVGSTPQRLLTLQNLIALGHEDLMLDYLKQICVESRSSGGAVEPPSVSGGCEVTQAAPALTFNDTSNFSSPVPHRRVSSLPLDAATPLRAVRVGTTIMEVHRHEKIRDATSAQHPETRPYPLSPAHDTLSRIRSENKHTTRPRSHSSWESPGFLYNNQGSLSEFRHPRHCVGYTFSKSRRSAPYVSQVVSSARTNFSHGGEGSHSLLDKELYGSKYSSSAATGGLQRPVASTFGLQRPNYLPHSSAAFLLSRGMEDRVNYDPIRLSGGADPHRITTREAIRRARAAVVSHRGRRPSRPAPSMDESKTGSPTETSVASFPGPGQYTLPSVDITSKAPRTPSVRIHPSKAHPIAHDRPNTGHSSRHLETKLNREYGNSAPEASDDKSEIPTSLSKPSSAANSNADRTTFSKAIRDSRKLYIGQQFVQQPTYTSIEESPIAERPQYYSAPLDTILNPKTKSGTKFAPSDPTEGQKQNRFHMYYSGKDFRSNMLGIYSPGPAQYPSINTVSKRKNKHQ